MLLASRKGAGRPDPDPASGPPPARPPGAQMKKQDFDKLIASVKQAGRSRRGDAKPSRADGPARALLTVAAANPRAVATALRA
jgi:hypothetical protein